MITPTTGTPQRGCRSRRRSTSSPTCRACSHPAAVPLPLLRGLVSQADTNTGLRFVTRHNVQRYLTTHSRYEGSSRARTYPGSLRPRPARADRPPVRVTRTHARTAPTNSGREPAMGRLKTSLGIWAFGSMVTRFMPVGYQPRLANQTTAGARAAGGHGPRRPDRRLRVPLPGRARAATISTRCARRSTATGSTRSAPGCTSTPASAAAASSRPIRRRAPRRSG